MPPLLVLIRRFAPVGAVLLLAGAFLGGEPHGPLMVCGLLGVLVGMTVLSLGLALWVYAILHLSQKELAEQLQRWSARLAGGGFLVALSGLTLLAGHFVALLLSGRLEFRWAIFWPSIVLAVGVCAWGVHRKVVVPLRDATREWEQYIRRESYSKQSMVRTFFREVLIQEDLRREDRFRWVRHLMIYWGFVGLFISDLTFAFISDFGPVLGLASLGQRSHPVRMAIDFSLDFFGVVLLIGVCLGLVRALLTWGKPGARYNYTVTTVFLFVVVVTGFWVEGIRLLTAPPVEGDLGFGGWGTAWLLQTVPVDWADWYKPLWIFHGLASAAFIAYIPFYRLVHCFAVPAGKLLRSQTLVYRDKLEGICRGLMGANK